MKYYDTIILFLNSVLKIDQHLTLFSNIGTAHLLTPWSLDQKVFVTWDLVLCPGWRCSNDFSEIRNILSSDDVFPITIVTPQRLKNRNCGLG